MKIFLKHKFQEFGELLVKKIGPKLGKKGLFDPYSLKSLKYWFFILNELKRTLNVFLIFKIYYTVVYKFQSLLIFFSITL